MMIVNSNLFDSNYLPRYTPTGQDEAVNSGDAGEEERSAAGQGRAGQIRGGMGRCEERDRVSAGGYALNTTIFLHSEHRRETVLNMHIYFRKQ